MTGYHDHETEPPNPPSRKRRALFLAFLLLASTLVYIELILRFSS